MKTWKQICTVGLLVLLLTGGITKADAEILTGMVVNKRPHSNNTGSMEVFIKVNPNRPYDHMLSLVSTNVSSTLYQLNLYKEFLVWYPQERGDIAWKESK